MDYDSIFQLKTKVSKYLRRNDSITALALVSQFCADTIIDVTGGQQIIELVAQIKPCSIDQLKHAKFILQNMPDELQYTFAKVLHQQWPDQGVFIQWLCEADQNFNHLNLCSKSEFIIQNYLENKHSLYFLLLILARNFTHCKKLLELKPNEGLELLFESIIRQNEAAFKLVRAKYPDIQQQREVLDQIHQSIFCQEKVKGTQDLD